jgi:peptide/nickel transport system substrate-binding protein
VPVPQGIEKAKEYLAASSYQGEKLVMQCMTGTPEERAAQIIQGQLLAVGINVEISAVDSATAITRRRTMDGLDLAISSHNSTSNDINVVGTVYAKSEIYTPFYSLDLLDITDDLITKGNVEMDPTARRAIYAKLANLVNEYALTITLYSLPTSIAYNAALKNVEPHFVGNYLISKWSW